MRAAFIPTKLIFVSNQPNRRVPCAEPPEEALALSKDTIGTAWASRVFFSKNYDSNGFFELTLTNFLG